MKKTVFTVIISLILMFCLISCGRWSMELKRPGEGEAPSENSGELSGGEELAPITPENSEEALRVLEDLNYTITNLYDGFFPLRDLDLTVAAENLVLAGDGRHFSYDLSLTNGAGKSLVLPGAGVYFFYSEDNDFASYTGGFCGKVEDLYYCSLGYAAKIDLISMTATPIHGVFETENDVWINGAMRNYNGDTLVLSTVMGSDDYSAKEKDSLKTVLNFYDAEGKNTESFTLPKPYFTENYYFSAPYISRGLRITESPVGRFFSYGGTVFNLETGEENRCNMYYSFSEKDLTVGFYADSESSPKNYYAVLFRNDMVESYIELGEIPLRLRDENDYLDGYTTFEFDENKFTVKDSYYAFTLNLDFDKKTFDYSFSLTEENLSEEIKTSADGKYSLWAASPHGGGDIILYNIVLKNNETGEIKYLGEGGGMYGGGSDEGFLKNGDIYIMNYDVLKIFDPETAELKFDLSKNFPLGTNAEDEIYDRGILTFRRDPEDMSFIIVYYEAPEDYSYEEINYPESDYFSHSEASFNYKIGFTDAEGNLLESYDTGLGVRADYFGLKEVALRYSEKELTLIVLPSRGYEGLTGVFDMETKEFTYDKETLNKTWNDS